VSDIRVVTLRLPVPALVAVGRVEGKPICISLGSGDDLRRVRIGMADDVRDAFGTIAEHATGSDEEVRAMLDDQPPAPEPEPLDAADVANILVAAVNEKLTLADDRKARRRWKYVQFALSRLDAFELLALAEDVLMRARRAARMGAT